MGRRVIGRLSCAAVTSALLAACLGPPGWRLPPPSGASLPADGAGADAGSAAAEAGSGELAAVFAEATVGEEVFGSLPPPRPTPYGFASGPVAIGNSVEGRPLEVYRFGYGPVGRFIGAGIHGGYEWNTIALARELIAFVETRPGIIPTDVTLYILPAINPDGEARAHGFDGRANSNGVDLSRNWNADWQADWPRSGCWRYRPITAGRYPASEPEVIALMTFLLDHPVDALISYHSAALGVFAGGSPEFPDSVELAKLISDVSGYAYPPLDTGCEFTGQFTDWAALQGIAAVDVELNNHRDTDFEINLRVLKAFLEWRR
jgi:hypothetical protein